VFPRTLFFVLIFSMLIAVPAPAKTMYITDSFKVTLRTGPSNEHKVIAMPKSNEGMEVLEEQDDWARVRLSDGKEGYVLSRFLTSDIPKSSVIVGLQSKTEKLKKEINSLREGKKQLEKSKLELGSSLFSIKKELTKVKKDYEELKSGAAGYIKVKELKDKLEIKNKNLENRANSLLEENKQIRKRRDTIWFVCGAGVLLLGWLLGLAMCRARIRHRKDFIKVDL